MHPTSRRGGEEPALEAIHAVGQPRRRGSSLRSIDASLHIVRPRLQSPGHRQTGSQTGLSKRYPPAGRASSLSSRGRSCRWSRRPAAVRPATPYNGESRDLNRAQSENRKSRALQRAHCRNRRSSSHFEATGAVLPTPRALGPQPDPRRLTALPTVSIRTRASGRGLDLAHNLTLDRRVGITPLERIRLGVRPVTFGSLIVDRARPLLAETEDAERASKRPAWRLTGWGRKYDHQ